MDFICVLIYLNKFYYAGTCSNLTFLHSLAQKHSTKRYNQPTLASSIFEVNVVVLKCRGTALLTNQKLIPESCDECRLA